MQFKRNPLPDLGVFSQFEAARPRVPGAARKTPRDTGTTHLELKTNHENSSGRRFLPH